MVKSWGKMPELDFVLAPPPDLKFGDLAWECFSLAKVFNQAPAEIAKTIAQNIAADEIIKQAASVGPYLNLALTNQALFKAALESSAARKSVPSQRIMVEYLSPNTNKPLHLGHLRNGALGMAMANLLATVGHKVIKSNLINDRGVHIAKSMLAWEKWGNNQTPALAKMKGDHFVGRWYVKFSQEALTNPDLEKAAQALLQRWEQGDKAVMALWKKMNAWVYSGFKETYQKFGLKFDTFYYESRTYRLGKDIISQGLKKGILKKEANGSVVFYLPEEFGKTENGEAQKATLLRSDGTSVYLTQDLGTALKKFKDYRLTQSIHVVGSEQNYHFRCLFFILEALGYKWAKDCHHLSYAMVYLPDGKMKSREGKVVDGDDLIDQVVKLAYAEVVKKSYKKNISEKEKLSRAAKIGVGAIKFYLLKYGPNQDIHFNPQESLSLEGATGPYLQYAYARAMNILAKVKKASSFKKLPARQCQSTAGGDLSCLGESLIERQLALKILLTPEKINEAIVKYNPAVIANHVLELTQTFSQFYHEQPVLEAKSKALSVARLALVKKTAATIKELLNILGIETMVEM